MGFENLGGKTETQTKAGRPGRFGAGHLIESIEDVIPMHDVDSSACIENLDDRIFGAFAETASDPSIWVTPQLS